MTHVAEPADDPARARWACLEEQTRREVDAHVLAERRVQAVVVVRKALHAVGLEATLGDAMAVVNARRDLFTSVRFPPHDWQVWLLLRLQSDARSGRVAAIEAFWDRDAARGWFVVLVAVLQHRERHVATVYQQDGGSPVGAVADQAGRALAHFVDVPFHFPCPDGPDDRAPRLYDTPRPSGGA
ncbi:hypothetical protein [Streptomyces sp. NPDC020983]|uniref:hypothetical protein n=1 Tax=Streptomyces sp. NPDC020983 TaxID=3365106 RepID=UPI0037BCF591